MDKGVSPRLRRWLGENCCAFDPEPGRGTKVAVVNGGMIDPKEGKEEIPAGRTPVVIGKSEMSGSHENDSVPKRSRAVNI